MYMCNDVISPTNDITHEFGSLKVGDEESREVEGRPRPLLPANHVPHTGSVSSPRPHPLSRRPSHTTSSLGEGGGGGGEY